MLFTITSTWNLPLNNCAITFDIFRARLSRQECIDAYKSVDDDKAVSYSTLKNLTNMATYQPKVDRGGSTSKQIVACFFGKY